MRERGQVSVEMRPERRSESASERGVSAAVGVVLMLAITVLLAATVASIALGFDDELQEPAPSGGFDQAYTPTGEDNTDNRPYVVLTHEVGRTVDAENIVIKDESGNSIRWNDVWTGGPEVKAGEYVHIDGFDSDSVLDPICEAGDTYRIVLKSDDGETLIVNEWEAPTDPQLPSGHPSNRGDGIPTWC